MGLWECKEGFIAVARTVWSVSGPLLWSVLLDRLWSVTVEVADTLAGSTPVS